MTIGLYALSLGTFLGGVWANESWGRYWSWDPKEVWSLISMMVYVFVLHMRLIPGMNNRFTYHVAALFSIGTLIMTYFGVNYYLSGMHSYATGDPVPIPWWVIPAIAILLGIVVIAYYREKQFRNSKDSQKQK
jgi:cytochrome c biogenesis factor